MDHRELIRILIGNGVDHVKAEVELVLVLEGNLGGRAVLVDLVVNELLPDALFGIGILHLCGGDRLGGGQLGDRLSLGVEDDRVEDTILLADCHLAVRGVGIKVDGIAGTENLLMIADLHHQLSLDDDIDLLTVMSGQLHGLTLRLGIVLALDIERLRDTVLERVSEVIIGHAVRLRDLLTESAAGHGIGFQVRGDTLNDLGDIDVQRLRDAVDERKVQILLARFTRDVLILGDVGERRHLGDRLALELAQLADSGRHLFYFLIYGR